MTYGTTLTDAARLLPTPTARDHKGESLKSRGGGLALTDVTQWAQYAPAIERWARIMDEDAPAPTDGEGRLNPNLVRWMMGYPAGWVDGLSRTARLRCLGNAIVPAQAATAWAHLLGIDLPTGEGESNG